MNELNRRDFVNLTIAAAAVTAMCNFCGVEEAQAGSATSAPSGSASESAPIDLGPASDYAANSISDKFIKKGQRRAAMSGPPSFFVIHNGDKIYAASAVCTHKGCILHTKGSDQMFCDCHSSSFSIEGTPTGGPAKSSLMRYKITKDDAGHLIVDPSKSFREAKWEDAESFVSVK
jgi:Rieske Fe-S protein